MNLILIPFMGGVLILELVGGILSLILTAILSGYFATRLILKILGLHSGSREQVRNEIKLTAGYAVLVVSTLALALITAYFSGD